jgi:hypothetical protein
VRFVVEKRYQTLPADPRSAEEDPTGTGGTSTTAPTPGEQWQPVSGVSFHPLMLQGLGGGDYNGENRDRFKGVLTSPDDWCTDSCGVGSVEIKPQCKKTVNEVKLGIFSGALSELITITVNP